MCEEGRGSANHIWCASVDYRQVARGGVAMTTIAYTSVSRDGLTFAAQPLLVEENFADLKRLADSVHNEGAAISVQLTHAGACVCLRTQQTRE